ncbi:MULTISPECIES: MmgE/PrpD family protein [Phyllobacteriaceae]|uniref:MmgE/PrpD family protein n=1 Tax=Phyllobacteriaceae TaxID=69277 RepID=UPI002ACAF9B2|nr:MmgE/PrpD family protein [Chelativorans sp. M5D2P16]MDZ5696611.1 MmgE/PrpD family protein [Chelativorans sp. M5D2P16]
MAAEIATKAIAHHTAGLEQAVARFATSLAYEDIPEAVRHQARRALVNILATGFAGCREPAIDKALKVLSAHSPSGNAVLVGRAERCDPLLAAFLNAMAANIHDYDDTHPRTVMHPSAPVVPALMAVAQEQRTSGRAFLTAFIAGAEAECRIGNAVSPAHYARGWHITSTCGVIGSALAASTLLRLDEGAAVSAIANAAVQACGMVQALGTMSKSISVGNAARNGLISARLAREGFTGPADVLGGEFGFIGLYSDTPKPEDVTEGLWERWEFASNTYKPYPVGVVLNPVVDAALELREQGLADPADIDTVTIRAHPLLRERTDRPDVESGRLSQVSAQHALSVAILKGRAGVAEFSDAAVAETRGRRPQIRFVDETERDIYSIEMRVDMKDGRVFTAVVEGARGSAANPMSDDNLSEKFRRHAEPIGLRNVDSLLERLWRIDESEDCGRVFGACGGEART